MKIPQIRVINRIREVRMEKAKEVPGFKNAQLVAAFVGRSGAWLSLIENNKARPSLIEAILLARLFGCKVEDLFQIEVVLPLRKGEVRLNHFPVEEEQENA